MNPYNVSTRTSAQPNPHHYASQSQVPSAFQHPTVPPPAPAASSSTTTMPPPAQAHTTYGYQPAHHHQPQSTYPTSNHAYNQTAVPPSQSYNPMYHTPYHLANATDKDPTWPEYQEGDPFIDWLERMQVTASSSRKYQHLIMYNSSNQLEFRSNLNQQDNILLYKMLLDGLPTSIATAHASTLRRTRHYNNGTALLARLRQEYDRSKTYTDTGKQNLIDQLRSLKRQKGESFKTFYLRFERHLTTMHDASADIPTDKELAKLLLIGLDSHTIRENWLNHIVNDSNPPSMNVWWRPNDLQYTYNKAEIYVNNVQSLATSSTPKHEQVEPKEEPDKSNETDSTSSLTSTSSAASSNKQLRKRTHLLESFYKDLLKSDNKKSVFKKYKEKSAGKCCFHPNADPSHEFVVCRAVPATVAEANCIDAWCDWRTDLQYGQLLKKERANRATTQQTEQKESSQAKQAQNLETVKEDGYESENTVESKTKDTSSTYLCSPVSNHPKLHASLQHQQTNNSTKVIIHRAKYVHSNQSTRTTIAVPDSGATSNFSGTEEHFEYIVPLPRNESNVLYLGDDTTSYQIQGIGPINVLLNGQRVRLLAYFTPALTTTLLSITKHIEYKGCYFHAEGNTYTMAYPRAVVVPVVQSEVSLNIQPAVGLPSTTPYIFDFLTDEKLPQSTSPDDNRAYRVIDQNKDQFLPTTESKLQHSEIVKFQRLHPNAKLPERKTPGSVGFDVYLPMSVTLQPNQITKIPTGLATSFPNTMYMRIADRSSLALQNLTIKGGVIDSDFRGDITILMENTSTVPITFTPDQRVAQFIFERAAVPQVMLATHLDATERNQGSFGSTNNHAKLISTGNKHSLRRLYFSRRTTMLYSTQQKLQPIFTQNMDTDNNKYVRVMRNNGVHQEECLQKSPTHIAADQLEQHIATTNPSPQQISNYNGTTTNMPQLQPQHFCHLYQYCSVLCKTLRCDISESH